MKLFALLFACLALCGCNQISQRVAPVQSVSAMLRPGQSWEIQNGAHISMFTVISQQPVDVTEANCVWRNVVDSKFSCRHIGDISIRDTRPILDLLAPPNQVTVQYRAWAASN